MKVAALQFDIAWEQRKLNYKLVERYLREARDSGADLLVLPEMFATGFSLDPSMTAEDERGETVEFMRSAAGKHEIAIVGGVVLRTEGGRGRNTALVVDKQGELISSYAKTHLFSFMGEEKFHLPGDGPRPFEILGTRCACFICYDLRFPELFRLVADETDCLFVIASWPAARQRHWDVLLPARAVENQLYLVGVNRVGQGGGLDFTGGSAIYSPLGESLAQAGEAETIITAEIEPTRVQDVRKQMPFLQDIRYKPIVG